MSFTGGQLITSVGAQVQPTPSGPIPAQFPGGSSSLPEITLESLGAVGDGVTDDTAAFNAAAKLTGVRITGTHSNYLISAEFNHVGQRQMWDMWGIRVVETGATNALSQGQLNTDGLTMQQGLWFLGGEYVGTGQTGSAANRFGSVLRQWTDVKFIGGIFHDFANAGLEFRNCTRVEVAGCYGYNQGISGGANFINFRDYPPNSSNLAHHFSAHHNTLDGLTGNGIVNGGINLIFTYGGIPQSQGAFCDISHNLLTVGPLAFCCVGLEIGQQGGIESTVSHINWSYNICVTAARSAIFFQDDGVAPTVDPNKITYLTIENNIFQAAGGGSFAVIHGAASWSSVKDNLVICTGTGGRCIYFFPATTDTTVFTNMTYEGNDLIQTAAATNNIIDAVAGQLTSGVIKGGSWRGSKTTTTIARWAEISGVTLDNPRTAFPASTNTAGASPFTVGPFPYDCFISIRAANGMTTWQAAAEPSSPTSGAGALLRRNTDTAVLTWATTAPTYNLTPNP